MHNAGGGRIARRRSVSVLRFMMLMQRNFRVDAGLGSMPMRVLIVDDHPIVASGCRALLAGTSGHHDTGAGDAESGEQAFVAEQPDVCIVDINLPTSVGV
jgi:PleD family two-component response regulator